MYLISISYDDKVNEPWTTLLEYSCLRKYYKSILLCFTYPKNAYDQNSNSSY